MHIILDTSSQDMTFTGTVESLLLQLHINPETVIVAKNGTLVQLDEVVQDTDTVHIMTVVSGG
ncbi:MAG: MoaD/ThiS family protein [Candidatus Woesearchaeota archaeon]